MRIVPKLRRRRTAAVVSATVSMLPGTVGAASAARRRYGLIGPVRLVPYGQAVIHA